MATAASTLLSPPITSRDHVRGATSAAVTLVVYGNYTCPHCIEVRLTANQLRAALGDRLRYVFRNLPKVTVPPVSRSAAEAAEAASAQGKFWELHDLLYETQVALSDKHLRFYATRVGLDMERFNRDMMLHTFAPRVEEDIQSARQSGVVVAPAFFINDSRYLDFFDCEILLAHLRREAA